MSDRFCRLYAELGVVSSIDMIFAHLSHCGIFLEFPSSKNIMMLAADDGAQVVVDRAGFDVALKTSTSISFQLWVTTSKDVYCRVRRVDGSMSIDFGMDGMTKEEGRVFVQCFISLAQRIAKSFTLLGLLVDSTGDCCEVDWDPFFLQKKSLVGPLPAILGVRQEESQRITERFPSAAREEIDGLVLFRLGAPKY